MSIKIYSRKSNSEVFMFSKRYLISQQCILLSLHCVSVTPLFAAPPEDPIRIKNVPALINYIKGKDKYNRQEALLKLQVMVQNG